MIALPEMLVGPAEEAGIKVPADVRDFDPHEYPYFQVYKTAQLGTPMPSPSSHWTNAKIIAKVPLNRILLVSLHELLQMGFEAGHPVL